MNDDSVEDWFARGYLSPEVGQLCRKVRAERDRLAAENARLEAQRDALLEALDILRWCKPVRADVAKRRDALLAQEVKR